LSMPIVDHQIPLSTINYHGRPSTTMVNHQLPWSTAIVLTMVDYDLLNGTMVNDHGQPWSVTAMLFNKT